MLSFSWNVPSAAHQWTGLQKNLKLSTPVFVATTKQRVKLVKSKIVCTNTVKFDEFWGVMVADLAEPKQFATQTKPFSAKYSGGRIMVTTSDSLWPIDRSSMRQIWTKALSMHEKMRFIHTNYLHENIRTSSYIISLMKRYVVDEVKME